MSLKSIGLLSALSTYQHMEGSKGLEKLAMFYNYVDKRVSTANTKLSLHH